MRETNLNSIQIVFLAIGIPIMLVSIVFGLVTKSVQNGENLYFKGVDTFIAQPTMYLIEHVLTTALPLQAISKFK
jgi:hypothetical protein